MHIYRIFLYLGLDIPDAFSSRWNLPLFNVCYQQVMMVNARPGWRLSIVHFNHAIIGILCSDVTFPISGTLESNLHFYIAIHDLLMYHS